MTPGTYVLINPLSAKIDQLQFSPNDVNCLERDRVMRMNKMVT